MPRASLPEPSITIDKRSARRYLLSYLWLWPPRGKSGKSAILDFIRQVGCIQYDPINVVGRNPDLVLQSRIKNYRPDYLENLLYRDRKLLDGYDKVQSIYDVNDWPHFDRFRSHMRRKHGDPDNPPMGIAPQVLKEIRERGPLSSIDFKNPGSVDWWWGVPARLPRATLELLYFMGQVGVHHRVNTRRIFDLIENLLPPELLDKPDPNKSTQAYHEWHVLRRVGGLGIANPAGTDHWLDMLGLKSQPRRQILRKMVESGQLVAVQVEEIPEKTFFIRSKDLPLLKKTISGRAPKARASVIAPLDNLMWDRDMVRWLFDFDYIWEVYKPAPQRRYGYYVLPVLYGEQFIARFEPSYDKKSGELTIRNWWWQEGVKPDERIERALFYCLREFMGYLRSQKIAIRRGIPGGELLYRVVEMLENPG